MLPGHPVMSSRGAQGQEPLLGPVPRARHTAGRHWAASLSGGSLDRGHRERLYSLEVFVEDAFAVGRGWIMGLM